MNTLQVCKDVISKWPVPAADYSARGNKKALMFLVGQCMKESKGTLDPKQCKVTLIKLL